MDNLILYSDKKEKLKYNLYLEGGTILNTTTKLCLEFKEGYNLYFKGDIDDVGNCVVNIDKLKEFEGIGRAKIEVITENTHFVIHEMPFEVKKKVNAKINEDLQLEVETEKLSVDIKFQEVQEEIIQEEVQEEVQEEIIQEEVQEVQDENQDEDQEEVQEETIKEENVLEIIKFRDYIKRK